MKYNFRTVLHFFLGAGATFVAAAIIDAPRSRFELRPPNDVAPPVAEISAVRANGEVLFTGPETAQFTLDVFDVQDEPVVSMMPTPSGTLILPQMKEGAYSFVLTVEVPDEDGDVVAYAQRFPWYFDGTAWSVIPAGYDFAEIPFEISEDGMRRSQTAISQNMQESGL